LLTSVLFQPMWTSFSDRLGPKPVILTCILFFTTGATISATAKSFSTLLAGRSIGGIGGAGLQFLTYGIVSDMVNPKSHQKWLGLVSLQWGIGVVIGPLIGGAFAGNGQWRGIFILDIPCSVISFGGIWAFLKLDYEREGQNVLGVLLDYDWLGLGLFILSFVLFMVSITLGKSSFSHRISTARVKLLLCTWD
jgi:MFS family permease